MDQIKKKYRAFHKPVIPSSEYEYLFEEASAEHVTTDVALQRPYVMSKDKEGTDVLTEVATGKFYYNLDTTVIEERISNGFYARPKDFFKDIKHLAHDIKNSGERDRIIKANEMISNVDVDITQIETLLGTALWEALHERQRQRYIESEEKRKRAAEAAAGSAFVFPDLANGLDGDSQIDPVSVGERVPPQARTMARFRVMSPFSQDQRVDAPTTNGDSAFSQPLQSGTDETQTTQPMSQMGPPQLPRSMHSQSLNNSGQPTAGGTQPFSQVSALTSLPPGVSPSALLNEASTTNEASGTHRSSGDWSAQATNGYHSEMDLSGSQQLPDTQPPSSHPGSGPSQHTASSHSPWIHSQADAMALGRLGHVGLGTDNSNNGQTSPTSSQQPATTSSRMGLTNLLNNPAPSEDSSMRNSGASVVTTSSSQVPVLHEGKVEELICDIARGTSGCTISQLEQINCELIKHLWASRHEWNRMKVLNDLARKFNETIEDIADVQGVGQSSQEEPEARDFYGSS